MVLQQPTSKRPWIYFYKKYLDTSLMKWWRVAYAMAVPSWVLVPRPNSSKITSDFGVAREIISEVSCWLKTRTRLCKLGWQKKGKRQPQARDSEDIWRNWRPLVIYQPNLPDERSCWVWKALYGLRSSVKSSGIVVVQRSGSRVLEQLNDRLSYHELSDHLSYHSWRPTSW